MVIEMKEDSDKVTRAIEIAESHGILAETLADIVIAIDHRLEITYIDLHTAQEKLARIREVLGGESDRNV